MEESKHIIASSFGLSKGNALLSDDIFEFKSFSSLSIAVLCDGVGSSREGRSAALHVVRSLITNFKNRPKSWSIEKSLLTFIENINRVLYNQSMQNYDAIEYLCTLCVVVIEGERLYGANVGDSRIYLHRNEKLSQLSIDHNEEDQDHVLTKAIGLQESVEPYYFENNLKKGDKLLLCSDGLYTSLDEEELKSQIKINATTMVKKANKKFDGNLNDDTSAIIIHINTTDEISSLKQLKLLIPEKLSVADNIDGFILQKSLIQNKRTWLCSKEDKEYVLKFPPLEAINDEDSLDLFVKEAWNASRLKAGFFAKAWIPEHRSMRYYVLDYTKGVSLKEYLLKKNLHVDDAINLAKFLLHTSQFLLKLDLVHGDIKPENIIVNKGANKLIFKMIDYGSIVDIFSINSKAGTPSYLAPERFEGASINEQSEIFAIGVTLYEALTLRYPYGEIEPFQNPNFTNAKSPKKYNDYIPSWFESIVLRSIAVDTDDRYQLYSHMNFELENSEKVKPYFDKSSSLIERDPLSFYKYMFYFMLILYIFTLYKLS